MCSSVKHETLSSLPSHNVWNSSTLAQHSVIFSDGGRSPSVNKLRCEIPAKTKRETRKSAKVSDLIRLTPIKSFVTYVSFPHATTLPVCPPQAQLTWNPVFGTQPRTPLTDDARLPPYRRGRTLATVTPEHPQPWAQARTLLGEAGWWRRQPGLLQGDPISASFPRTLLHGVCV